MTRLSRLFRLAALAAVATFLLIALGGLSRTQTGPGCPDWPLCQGGLLPPLDAAMVVDWLHRTVSASLGLLLLATAVVAGRTPGAAAGTRRAAWAAVGLLLLQSGIGALTVGVAPAWASTLHLGLAMLLFAATLLTLLAAGLDRGAPGWLAGSADPVLRRAALVGAAA
ncbi:MAG: COX15/CtaA family protein, partial [Chloroflexia bacterium]|nr:COX15/CtaA family protein [Chloroflexia bacterium]